MTLLKTALKNLRKNPGLSLLYLIQCTALFLAAAVMVSSLYLQSKVYLAFKDYYSGEGFCFFALRPVHAPDKQYGYTDHWEDYYTDKEEYEQATENIVPGYRTHEELLAELSAEDMVCAYEVFTDLYPETKDRQFTETFYELEKNGRLDELGDESIIFTGISYDDEIIKRYTPELKEGRWLDLNAGSAEAVIADCDIGLNVGDEVWVWQGSRGEMLNVKVKIVGILKDKARVFGTTHTYSDPDHRTILPEYSAKDENNSNNPVILFSHTVLEKHSYLPITQDISRAVLLKYPDGTPAEVINKDKEKLVRMGADITVDLPLINDAAKSFIGEQIYMLMPTIVILLLLTLISGVSVSALSMRHRLRDYAKFYIVGLTWKKCIAVNLIQALFVTLSAAGLAAVGTAVVNNTELAEKYFIAGNLWTAAALLIPALANILFSMIMPLLMLSRTTPKQILTR